MPGNGFRRNITLLRILQLIRLRGPLSRAEISRRTGLKRSSITQAVQELLSIGVLEEKTVAPASSQGGRKPVLLGFQDAFGCFAGFEPTDTLLRVVVISIDGKVILREEIPRRPSRNVTEFTAEAASLLSRRYAHLAERLISVGFAIPGAVDPPAGIIRDSWFFSLKDAAVAPLRDMFPWPLYIDNDSNCCLWGELLAEKSEQNPSMVYLLPKLHADARHPVDLGVGIAVDGSVYYGSSSLAGEATTRRWYERGAEDIGFQQDILTGGMPYQRAKQQVLYHLLKHQLPFFRIFDPRRIIIGGDYAYDWEMIKSVLTGPLNASWFSENNNFNKVHPSRERAYAAAYGAASGALIQAFTPPQAARSSHESRTDIIPLLRRISGRSPCNA